MACLDDSQFCFRKGLREFPRALHWGAQIVAALDDDGWDMADFIDVSPKGG